MSEQKLFPLKVRRSDIGVLLDAIENAYYEFDIMESCTDTDCPGCLAKKESLSRLRDELLSRSPLRTRGK